MRAGARGAVRLLGLVPVPAEILEVRPGRSWRWRVGGVLMDHRVDPRPGGCTVAIDLTAPAPAEALLRVSYGPAVALLVRRLAREAEAAEPGGR